MRKLPMVESGAELRDASLVAIMLHGRGGSAADMAELGAAFEVEKIRFICPQAPGNTWYPFRFIEPIGKNQPHLDNALATVREVVQGLKRQGIDEARIVLGGFSQGACLAAEFLVRNPETYAAALIFTGGLIGPPGTTWTPPRPLANVPVLLTGCEIDQWIPVARTRETADVLVKSGAMVELVVYSDRPHTVSPDEIRRAQTLLRSKLA